MAAGDLSVDGFLVGEPTGLDVCTAARGQYEGTITITGAAAHAATPESGANAIRAVAPVPGHGNLRRRARAGRPRVARSAHPHADGHRRR